MGSALPEFLARLNIEISPGPSGERNGPPIPRYEVILRKGEREESFVIFGDPESEQRITPGDVLRALLIRIRLHETNAALSPGSEKLCSETATRLKEFLGPEDYSDLLNLDMNSRHALSEKVKPGFRSLRSYPLLFQNFFIGQYRQSVKIVLKFFTVLSIPLANIWKYISAHMPKNTQKL
ncbi:MAG TPA: hypothetical protein VFG19_03635 [Geobacteraceae bacterium]|nr:hypothetical protein [Geobacteraceae bacterium]